MLRSCTFPCSVFLWSSSSVRQMPDSDFRRICIMGLHITDTTIYIGTIFTNLAKLTTEEVIIRLLFSCKKEQELALSLWYISDKAFSVASLHVHAKWNIYISNFRFIFKQFECIRKMDRVAVASWCATMHACTYVQHGWSRHRASKWSSFWPSQLIEP